METITALQEVATQNELQEKPGNTNEVTWGIDKELRNLLPRRRPEELALLEKNLQETGCRQELVGWNGIILFGLDEFEIYERLGIPYQVNKIECPDRQTAFLRSIEYYLSLPTLGRYEKVKLALLRKEFIAAAAKENQRRAGRRSTKDLPKLSKVEQIHTRKEIAKLAGVSNGVVQQVELIEKHAPDELKRRIADGKESINSAFQKIQKEVRKKEKQLEYQRLIEEARGRNEPDDFGVWHGDFRKLADRIPDASIDLIFTDPPYLKEFLSLYGDLGKVAAQKLKPGGSLIAYTGQHHLPEVLDLLEPHLTYYWTLAVIHGGGIYRSSRMKCTGVIATWKPLVWFVKGHRRDRCHLFADSIQSTYEKGLHPWQQSTTDAEHCIKNLTKPGDLVVDFFCGSGTTGVAAKRLGRNWICIEKDEHYVCVARKRIKETELLEEIDSAA